MREQSHRRATLLATTALLALGTSPVFGHHVALGAGHLLDGVDHVGVLCLTALHLLLAPVHHGFHVLLLAGFGYALCERRRAWSLARRALGPLEAFRVEPGDPFWAAAISVGVDPQRIRVVEGLPVPALTVGFVRPAVYVAQDLADELGEAELAAVLAHEGAHMARHDPLRLFVLRLVAQTLFWIPALRRLADDVADEAEILADDRAARGRPLALATAILTLARRRSARPAPDAASGFHHADLLERRVRRLAGEDVRARSHVTRRSVLGALAVLSLVWVSGIVVAHPLPSAASPANAGHRAHCDHHAESPFAHLFCLSGHRSPRATECPHGSGNTLRAHPLT